MPYVVADFKRELGYGLRSNLYEIELKFPSTITNIETEKKLSILCTKVSFPAPRKMEAISVNFKGDTIKLAGDKAAEDELKFTFMNAENLKIRTLFEQWIELIQQDLTGIRTSPDIYKSNWFIIKQFNHKKEIIYKASLTGVFPTNIAGYELSTSDEAKIIDTEVSINFDSKKIESLV